MLLKLMWEDETLEGDVHRTLLKKLEQARKALPPVALGGEPS